MRLYIIYSYVAIAQMYIDLLQLDCGTQFIVSDLICHACQRRCWEYLLFPFIKLMDG